MFFKLKRGPVPARRNVPEDWLAALPREKSQVFEAIVREWERAYAMMSVALNDALSLRARGELVCARQQVSIAAQLFSRFAQSLMFACDAVSTRGRHVSDLPLVEPLNTDFFRGDTGQSAASWNSLLHHVLFGGRSRFFHKLRILSGTVAQLDSEFEQAAAEISEGTTVHPSAAWKTLDSAHYDLNTCLRESEIVLKAFLRSLPSEQFTAFAGDMDKQPPPCRFRVPPSPSRVSA